MLQLRIPFLFVSLCTIICFLSPLSATPSTDFETEFLNQLNVLRSQEKRQSLSLDPQLKILSNEWSTHLAQKQKSFHRSPSSLLLFSQKQSYSLLSENLHDSPQGNDPTYLLQRWIKSPLHRNNLLNPKISLMAISITQDSQGVWYGVWNGAAKNQ